MPSKVDPTLPLFGMSPVQRKPVHVRFAGSRLSSDGGVLLLAEIEQRLGIAQRLDPRCRSPRANF